MSTPPPWQRSQDILAFDWERVRQQIEHEDTLINHRITWNIQISAMLLAAFAAGVWFIRGPAFASPQNVPSSYVITSIWMILSLLILFGFLTSFITFRSVRMANVQIQRLDDWWRARATDPQFFAHPPLLGEKSGRIDRIFSYGYVVPVSFMVLWLSLGFAVFYEFPAKLLATHTRDWIYGLIIIVLVVSVLYQQRRLQASASKAVVSQEGSSDA